MSSLPKQQRALTLLTELVLPMAFVWLIFWLLGRLAVLPKLSSPPLLLFLIPVCSVWIWRDKPQYEGQSRKDRLELLAIPLTAVILIACLLDAVGGRGIGRIPAAINTSFLKTFEMAGTIAGRAFVLSFWLIFFVTVVRVAFELWGRVAGKRTAP